MANITRRDRPSLSTLQRDVDDALDEFSSPRALRREIDRLFRDDLGPHSVWQALDRLFEDFVSPLPLRRRVGALFAPLGVGSGMGGAASGRTMFVPDLELVEREKEYAMNIDLPGVRPEDVKVTLEDDILTIRGERREEENKRARGYEYTERRYGSFTRSVELPRGVDRSAIVADYRDGVLQLRIPKTGEETGASRQIPVNAREAREAGREQAREGAREQPRVVQPGNGGSGEKRETRTEANGR
jgi:HSP20 family protein